MRKSYNYTFPIGLGEDAIVEIRIDFDPDQPEPYAISLIDQWGRERERHHYIDRPLAKYRAKTHFRRLVQTTPFAMPINEDL